MKELSNKPTNLNIKYKGQPKFSAGWYYEEKFGMSIFADTENTKRKNNFLGDISKRKLLGIVSRIYGIDFKKYIKK